MIRQSNRFRRFVHGAGMGKCLSGVLICSLLFTLMPKTTMAQEGGASLFLPAITSGLGKEAKSVAPIDGFDDTAEEQIEAAMLVEAAAELPEPPPPVAAPQRPAAEADFDADGVVNGLDLCPHQPNPPVNGVQEDFCGKGLLEKIDHYVFLQSRIFLPAAGLDPELKNTQARDRIHVLLHVIPNQHGIMMTEQQRIELQNLGVTLLSYLPQNTYYASVPRNLATLQQIVSLEHVRGISPLHPEDKVAPQLRVQGPQMGRNSDGTVSLDVDFFDDVPQNEIEAQLNAAKIPFSLQYDKNYRLTLHKWQDVQLLTIQDIVQFIDDLPDEVFDRTQNAQTLINGQVVSNTLGLRGSGITVSVVESGLANPITRPEVSGRVILGNNPIFETKADEDHTQMVSSILIADETTFPERAGLLPEAILSSYSASGLTIKAAHYGVNRDAHDDYGAILSNNSWGPHNCAKEGEYRKRGKFFDRTVHDEGVVVVYAAGNTSGPDGDFAGTDCEGTISTLPHPVAKNDISVGNWDIDANALNSTSAVGPAADGRLKPDLIAPGQGIETIGWDEEKLVSYEDIGGGTSAAAPVVSGVVGWMAESFKNQGMVLDSIMPARYKAILVHTAKDTGPSGPDDWNGYGLIQADRALRIAEEWSLWGREGTVDANTPQVVFNFDVDSAMTSYKATLVWDDEEGDNSSTLALYNDLDLTLISPSGEVYYPYDTLYPDDDGSSPCQYSTCQDRLNNVEMVMVDPSAHGFVQFIEQGTWQAVVDTHRLVSPSQDFSLVLSPPCPVVIDESVTLTGDINCEPNALEPTGVLIENNDVELNCDNHTINGQDAGKLNYDGTYVGVRVLGYDATVRNCEIRHFDVGIKVGDAGANPRGVMLSQNTLSNLGTRGIELSGSQNTAQGNSITKMIVASGKGIVVTGDTMTVDNNQFHDARAGNGGVNSTVGIQVNPLGDYSVITGNRFDGNWWYGIRLRSGNTANSLNDVTVDHNHIEGIDGIPIDVSGEVDHAVISANDMQAYGPFQPGINATSEGDGRPQNTVISGNTIIGFISLAQTGVQLTNVFGSSVINNRLSVLASGIVAANSQSSVFTGNHINDTAPPGGFITGVGISDNDSSQETQMSLNVIRFTQNGIVVNTPVQATQAQMTQNTLDVNGVGISVNDADNLFISTNTIRAQQRGIAIFSSPKATVSDNGLTMRGTGAGIVVGQSDQTTVVGNNIISPTVGIGITNTTEISVTGNSMSEPQNTGIIVSQDTDGRVTNNVIDRSTLGIHYMSGDNGVLASNRVNSNSGGTGIRLGTGAAACLPIVNNILVENNVLSGGTTGVEVLCNVGTHILINN